MTQAKIGHLKNHLSRYVDMVRDGREVVILDRETPVARIVPLAYGGGAAPDGERLTRLERRGLIRRGAKPGAKSSELGTPVKVTGSVVAEMLAERRESR